VSQEPVPSALNPLTLTIEGLGETMNWREYIHLDPAVLTGKPVVRGTRLGVDFFLELLAAGWTADEVLDSYPQLTPEAIRAVFAFAAESMREESFYAVPLEAR
jgi:uncharacterized protein (DUF433 family)